MAQMRLFVSSGDRAVLFSSHIIPDVEKAADIVTIIKDGRILLSQSKEDLLSHQHRKDGVASDLERFSWTLWGRLIKKSPWRSLFESTHSRSRHQRF
jgi:ABC-type multidrug transport system ATPase subunit